MYYAISNELGFANTYTVFAFSTRAERDDYVSEHEHAECITRAQVPKYIEPSSTPFSRRAFMRDGFRGSDLTCVDVCTPDHPYYLGDFR